MIRKFAYALGKFLFYFSIASILIILFFVITQGWSESPYPIKTFGKFLNWFSDIPIIGNLSFLFWALPVFPGYLLMEYFEPSAPVQGQSRVTESKTTAKFKVYVDDHFHYMDEDERYLHGEFDDLTAAKEACEKIVDDCLVNIFDPSKTSEEMYESYMSFGDDPFIEGGNFDAAKYAEQQIEKYLASIKSSQKNERRDILDPWKLEVKYKYGLLLPESEILEDDEKIYFCQTDRHKLIAGWDKVSKKWFTNCVREDLEGLSFSTPKRFEEIVFGHSKDEDGYYEKQFLIEYLLFGIGTGEIKTLTKSVNDEAIIEFSLDNQTWNEMLIGNKVGVEGMCKHLKGEVEQILNFALLCEKWNVTTEIVFDEYDNFEQDTFSIKQFGNYYS